MRILNIVIPPKIVSEYDQEIPQVVGSLYIVFSKLTLCTIRVSLDQKRWQVHSNPFWYNLHLLNN